MTRRYQRNARRHGRRGFTLVELVIVGALIAIFSSLAVFSVQQQFESNLRKAAIGEARQIATSLDFANLDSSIFPKLCFLNESQEGLQFIEQQLGVPSGAVFANMDILSRQGDLVFASRIFGQWNGPYFALSQARAGISQGRSGFVYMLIPQLPPNGPNSPTSTNGLRWPADPWGNPYVVYMLDINVGATPRLALVNETSATEFEPTRKGNYANAVVSYGPNRYPGGVQFEDVNFLGGASFAASGGSSPYALRLYSGRPGFTGDGDVVRHTWFAGDGNWSSLGIERANIWSREFFNAGGVSGGLVPPSGLGIADVGADDVVFEF